MGKFVIYRKNTGYDFHLKAANGETIGTSEIYTKKDACVDGIESVIRCAGTVSSGIVKIVKDLDEPIEGKDVLIVEDIIDSGNTLSYLIEVLKQRNPRSIELCTLLDKPERRVKKQVQVRYTCFTIPDEFVVGYGLDYDQKYRNLPYIGVVEV